MHTLILLLMALPVMAQPGTLRAGAARMDITPAAGAALPMSGYGSRVEGHKAIHDNLYVRALVLDDGARQAVVVSFDLLFVTDEMWNTMAGRIAQESGIARDAILLAGTHTHGGPALGRVKPEFEVRWKPWREMMETRTLEAVRQARAALLPARFGIGRGKAYANTNRRARMANGGWGLGVNPQGVSDKTLAVVKFETLQARPIALLINYGVHGTVMGPRNYDITGDLPGAASRYVEEQIGDGVVAPWTSAASGDQNAIYGPGSDFRQMEILGRMVGEEVVRVAAGIRTSPRVRIAAMQKVITCPGRKMTPESNTSQNKIAFVDADPVDIRLSLLKLNHIALAGVSGEVLTPIGQRLQHESPLANTLMTTHTNGSSGYIPDDDAYHQVSYEIWVTRAKPGCAESAIVNGFLDMIDQM
ncbi:MAG: neutral/alkaline non-lysosomal ceramidase N-terminal domain-containing protein [Bryobacteraceae bacterium]|nr:neutral/alkaline non-lysosomal ceramidase N-terminal domain-containing protein [Bryobacteraceae bacterium]